MLIKKALEFCLLLTLFDSPLTWALSFKGELTQGSLVIGQVDPGSQVEFAGKAVRVNKDGHFVIGFGRDDELSQTVLVTNPAGIRQAHKIVLSKREYNIQRVNGISKKIMNPSEKNLTRIRAEAALVKEARKPDTNRNDIFENFTWPLEGPVTGVYGSQRVYNGKPGRPHYGLDIAAPTGTPVKAPADGVVVLAHKDMFYSGGTLIVDHGHGVFSTFIHMHKVLAEPGQEIKQGDVIGQVGATGRATGPHLDWRMNWFDVRVDPRLILPEK